MKLMPSGVRRLSSDKVAKVRALRGRALIIAIGVMLAIVLIVLLLANHYHKSSKMEQAQPGASYQQYSSAETKQADGEVNKKDYQGAADLYLSAAHDARLASGVGAGISVLQDAVTKIPTPSINWALYSTLADYAGVAGNKTLEKQSLTKAIQGAGMTDSGCPPAQLTLMQKNLSQL